jgi:hypothetical protein
VVIAPGASRVVRETVFKQKTIDAAHAVSTAQRRMLTRHILPNTFPRLRDCQDLARERHHHLGTLEFFGRSSCSLRMVSHSTKYEPANGSMMSATPVS